MKLFVICSKISDIQNPHRVATSHLNHNKIQITGLNKMRDTKQGIEEQTPVIKVSKSELK